MRMQIVSVIMPCYNASAYMREAIESVKTQSYKDWELLIIDDGSTDNSKSIAQEYAGKDKRIRLIEQPNSGACRARNNGIEHARGEYIKFLDADDVLEKDCLAMQVIQIRELDARQIPFGDYYNVDQNGNICSKYEFNRQRDLLADPVFFFFTEWRVLISAPLHRIELLNAIGGFDESLKRGQEFDMHLRLALADVEFVYKPCVTFRYRDHHGATRISETSKLGTTERKEFQLQRANKCEQLLVNKYGRIPLKYHQYFINIWFSHARELFAVGRRVEGKVYLDRALIYGGLTNFQKTYYRVGKMFGFVFIEKMLRIRLILKNRINSIS